MNPVLFPFFESCNWIPKACGSLGSLESEQYKSLFFSIGDPIKVKGKEERDSRWQQSRWKLQAPPFRINLKLQLNYRTIILNNKLKTS